MASSSLPPPFEWPTARRLRLDRIAAAVLGVLAVAPPLLLAVWAFRVPLEGRDAPLVLLLQSLLIPAALAPIIWTALDRRRHGLILKAIRGGRGGAIEVRARSGGRGLVIPLAESGALGRVYRVGLKRIIASEAVTQTGAGEVLFGRGGTSLDRDLVRWIERVLSSSGSTGRGADSLDVEGVASGAARDPLDAPPSIQARLAGDWPTYSYRAVEPRGSGFATSLAVLLLVWLVFYPLLGIFSFAKLAIWIVPLLLFLAWMILLAGPLTVELEVRGPMLIFRRRRFGLTLWASVNDANQTGLEISQLPFVALRVKGRLRGFTTPAIGGPDVVEMAWLSAAIRATAARVGR